MSDRFDVIYDKHGCHIDYHFCREWGTNPETGEMDGCYGTNPHHGYTWEEARAVVAEYYQQIANEWRTKTQDEWEEPFKDLHEDQNHD